MEKWMTDWNEAVVLRLLEPKERHIHFIRTPPGFTRFVVWWSEVSQLRVNSG